MKQVLPQTLSPPGSTPWTQHQRDQPSPTSSLSLGSISPGAYSPCRTLDTSGSSASFSSDQPQQKAHHWKNGPVEGWSNDQVLNDYISSLYLYLIIIIFFFSVSGLSMALWHRPRTTHSKIH